MVHGEPEGEPDESGEANEGEGGLPAGVDDQVGDDGGREDGADGGAGVEEPGGEGAFLFGEPLGDDFDGSGPVAGLADAEKEAEDAEAEGAAGEGVEGGGDAPPGDAQSIAEASAEAIDHGAGEAVHDGVSEQEGGHDARVVLVGHVELFAENGRGHGERLAIEIVDDGREEGERDHLPAERGRGCLAHARSTRTAS